MKKGNIIQFFIGLTLLLFSCVKNECPLPNNAPVVLGPDIWAARSSGVVDGLNNIQFVSTLVGYVVGENGVILKTTDAGKTFDQLTSGVNLKIDNLFFVNANIGYVIGDLGTVLKTVDGGNHWTNVSPPAASTYNLRGIYFLDANTGFVAGNSGHMYKTTDGALNWTPINSGIDPAGTFHIYCIYFLDSNTGYFSGSGMILSKTTNGGLSWTPCVHPLPVSAFNVLFDIKFINQNIGYAVGGRGIAAKGYPGGNILQTIDGGASWQVQTSPVTHTFFKVRFSSPVKGYLVGTDFENSVSSIVKTIDGTNWTIVPSNTNNLYGFDLFNGDNGCAVGVGGLVVNKK